MLCPLYGHMAPRWRLRGGGVDSDYSCNAQHEDEADAGKPYPGAQPEPTARRGPGDPLTAALPGHRLELLTGDALEGLTVALRGL